MEKVKEIYKKLCKTNDEIITKNDTILSIGFLIDTEKEEIIDIPLQFRDGNEKEMFRQALFKIILEKGIKAYVLIFDTKITRFAKGEPEVNDCVMRTLYTPKEVVQTAVLYKDKKIIERIDFSKLVSGVSMTDNWNVWGQTFDENNSKENEANNKYQKYKRENPEKYEGV